MKKNMWRFVVVVLLVLGMTSLGATETSETGSINYGYSEGGSFEASGNLQDPYGVNFIPKTDLEVTSIDRYPSSDSSCDDEIIRVSDSTTVQNGYSDPVRLESGIKYFIGSSGDTVCYIGYADTDDPTIENSEIEITGSVSSDITNEDSSLQPYYLDGFSYGFNYNQFPEFNSTSVSPDSPLIGENVSYSAEAYDPDGTVSDLELTLFKDGSQVFTDSVSQASYTWSDVYTAQEGSVDARFVATDDAGASTTEWLNRTLQDSAPSFSIVEPVNQLYDSQSRTWKIDTDGGDDSVPDEEYSVDVQLDGSSVGSASITEGDNASGSFTAADGSHTLSVTVTEGDGDSTTKSVNFEVDTQAPELEIFNPSGDLDRKKNLDLDYLVEDPNLDSSSCQYSKDGGANFSISNCQNTTVTFNTVGEHSLTVYASDTLGHTSQEITTFTTNFENRISLEDNTSGSSVQDFEVVFSNGSASAGGSTSDGQFEIFTSELPRGDVSMTLKADGYVIRNVSLSVDDSFELRESYVVSRAAFSLDVFDAVSEKDLNFNFTATNETVSFSKENVSSFEKEYRDFDSIGFPTGDVRIRVQDVDGEYKARTYFATVDENAGIFLDAYLLQRGSGIYTTIETYTGTGESLSNVRLSVQRLFGTTWKTVSQKMSTSSGDASFFLDPDTRYRLLATHPSYSAFQGTFSPANYQYNPLKISLGQSNRFGFSTILDHLSLKLRPNQEVLEKGNQSFNFTVSDSQSQLQEFGIKISDVNGSVLKQNFVSSSPSGGTVLLEINLSEYSVDEIFVSGYVVRDGESFSISNRYGVYSPIQAGKYSLVEGIEYLKLKTSETAQGFLSLILTFSLAVGMGRRFNAEGAGAAVILALGVFTWFDLFPWEIYVFTFLGVLGIYLKRSR